ncbi:MAG: hypothetical protein KIS83_20135 [Rubrivivax sp.]|nr:hypothetical protein [Rubrivivax sp.]
MVRPLDLLRLRPDLLAAEQALVAAAAEVGVAEAALRPQLRLPGRWPSAPSAPARRSSWSARRWPRCWS